MSKVDKDLSKKSNTKKEPQELPSADSPSINASTVESILKEVRMLKEESQTHEKELPEEVAPKDGLSEPEEIPADEGSTDEICEHCESGLLEHKHCKVSCRGHNRRGFKKLRGVHAADDASNESPKSEKIHAKILLIVMAIILVVPAVALIIASAVYSSRLPADHPIAPIEESSTIVKMDSMYFEYIQESPFVPNDGFSQVVYNAQLFSASDYYVYLTADSGEVYHTPLTQCKLVRNEEDLNTSTVKTMMGISHPFILFNMDDTEFSDNVSPLFMPGFSDGMVSFVYQYLAETLPLEESPESN